MNDRENSTPPPVFREADHIFRVSVLWRFKRSEELVALEAIADLVTNWLFEHGTWTTAESSPVRGNTQAVAQDLLLIASYLREAVAGERHHSSLSPSEARLSEMADSWARRAEQLGKAMLGALEVA